MKVLFLGTPDFGVEALKTINNSKHNVLACVTQPDRCAARGHKMIKSPIKREAEKLNIPVLQFEDINKEGVQVLGELGADIAITAAFGQILKHDILSMFKYGIINAHASILPKYRGSSPIQCALLAGEKEIGVSIMETVKEVDAGDIYLIKSYKLEGHENAEDCFNILSKLAAEALIEVLDSIESKQSKKTPQNHAQATFCKKISKEDGKIDFDKTADFISNQIRAYTPWPSAYCNSVYGGMKFINGVCVENYASSNYCNGTIVYVTKEFFVVKCGSGFLKVTVVQLENGKTMSVHDFLLGRPLKIGDVFY